MALAARGLLAAVVAAFGPAAAGGAGRLRVHDGGRQLLGPASRRPGHVAKRIVKALEGAVVAPANELGMDRVPGWEVTRQHPPRTFGTKELKDGFRHLSTGPLQRSAGGGG